MLDRQNDAALRRDPGYPPGWRNAHDPPREDPETENDLADCADEIDEAESN